MSMTSRLEGRFFQLPNPSSTFCKRIMTTTTNDPFLETLFVEPNGGGACRQWDTTRVDLGQSPVCNTLYNICAC